MKILLKITLVLALIGANLFADSSANISIVAKSSNTISISGMEYGFGLGFDHKWENGIVLGGNGDFTYVDLNLGDSDSNMINVLFEGTLGYAYNDLQAYAVLPMLITSSNSINSQGFGYGVGVKYQINESFGVKIEYVSTSMTDIDSDLDYDYDNISLSVSYKY